MGEPARSRLPEQRQIGARRGMFFGTDGGDTAGGLSHLVGGRAKRGNGLQLCLVTRRRRRDARDLVGNRTPFGVMRLERQNLAGCQRQPLHVRNQR